MPHLIAIAYEDETTAAQAAEELERRADDLPLDPAAIGVVVCERNGSYQLGATHHPNTSGAWSKFWGVLFGVLMGEIESSAIDSKFRDQIAGLLTPGSSMLFTAVERVGPEAVLEALSQYGGTALHCPLARDGMVELWETLDGEQARS